MDAKRPARNRPRALVGAVLAVTIGALFVSVATAQVPDRPPDIRPFSGGPFLLYPLFSAEAGYTDNLFFSDDDRISTPWASASIGILAELPYSKSEGSIGYVAQWLDYQNVDVDQQFGQFFDADTVFRFGGGAFVGVEAEFQDGVLDTRLFDPGGEITFRLEPFTRWSVGLEAGHELAERRLIGLRARREELRFDRDPLTPPSFFDTDTTELRLRGEHGRATGMWWIWDLASDRSDLLRPQVPPVDSDDVRRYDSLTARAGIRRRFDRRSRLEILAGWTDRRFRRFGGDTTEQSFSGVVYDVRFARGTPGGIQLDAALTRSVLPSAFQDADYYVSDQLRASVANAYEARLVLDGAIALFRNRYPPGLEEDRSDDLLEARARIGYRFLSGFVWDIRLSQRYRDSSIDGLDYDEFRIETSIRLGS